MPIYYSLKIPKTTSAFFLNFGINKFKKIGVLCLCLFFSAAHLSAQSLQSADSLFQIGQKLAFTGEYDTAITLINRACDLDTRDMDKRLALARVYAWRKDYDLAEKTARIVVKNQPQNRDALHVLSDIYLWSKNYNALENLTQVALKPSPKPVKVTQRQHDTEGVVSQQAAVRDSSIFLKKLASSYVEQARYEDARDALAPVKDSLPPQWKEVQRLLMRDMVTAHYTYYDYRNGQTDWQTLEVDYQRIMRRLTLIASVNAASRFNREGLQFMIQAYPKVGNRAYAWLLAGNSNGRVFPNWVYGGSFFMGLPKGFEGELGIRFFKAGVETASMLRAGLSYQKHANWLAYNFALIRGVAANGTTHTLSYRRYFEQESYVQFSIGTGSTLANSLALPLDNFIINNNAASVQLNYWFQPRWRVLAGVGFERSKFNEQWQSRLLFNIGISRRW